MKKIFLALMAIMAMGVAQAQNKVSVSGDTKDAVIAFQHQNRDNRGCAHMDIRDGNLGIERCSGLYPVVFAGYSSFHYSSEEWSSETSAMEIGAGGGYRAIVNQFLAIRPEATVSVTGAMTFEGLRATKAQEVNVKIGLELFAHSPITFTVAPQVAYHNVKSLKDIDTEEYKLHIPYTGNVFMYGVGAELGGKLFAINSSSRVYVGNKYTVVRKHHPVKAFVGGSWMTGEVSKPVNGKLNLDKYSVYAKLTVGF